MKIFAEYLKSKPNKCWSYVSNCSKNKPNFLQHEANGIHLYEPNQFPDITAKHFRPDHSTCSGVVSTITTSIGTLSFDHLSPFHVTDLMYKKLLNN